MLMDTRRRGRRPGDGGLPLAEPRWLAERTFRPNEVPAVRRLAEAFGARAGLRPARLADFVLAASEAAACAAAWGPCITRVRLWMTGRRAFCEVRGDAMIMRRAAGRGTEPPDGLPGEEAALRRWVLRQVCDSVSVASGPDGARVLVSMSAEGG
jgi:hypothetical protein